MIRRTVPIEAAKQILAENNVLTPPVDIETIVQYYGVEIAHIALPDDVSGILYVEDEKNPKILINRMHHQNRKRFTMAHELGHYILHNKKGIHIDKKSFSRNTISQSGLEPIEVEANSFASEILMPRAFIEDEIKDYDDFFDIDKDIIVDMAAKFQVSAAAMSIRLQSLGYLPKEF